MRDVSLTEMLAARDLRRDRQQQLFDACNLPLICFTMNIAGPQKRSRLIDLAFQAGLEAVTAALGRPLQEAVVREDTGCEGLLVYDLPAAQLKAACMALEEQEPVGRLYDLDVRTPDGAALSRPASRRCLCCEKPAAVCARSRAHGLAAVQAETQRRLRDFAPGYLGGLAVEALKEEAALTPKPGLVDRRNCGAHRDMDYALLLRSAETLRPYLTKAVRLGMTKAACMPQLQKLGQDGEAAMLAATGGVNTHKGALYGFLLLLAAMGSLLSQEGDLFARAAALAKAGAPAPANTNGAKAVQTYRVRGARQEAEAGFPAARAVYAQLSRTGDRHGALMHAILQCDDTNLLHRGGAAGLDYARQWAERVLAAPPACREALLLQMDDAMIRRNLSPGGSADLLAQALLLQKTQCVWA